MKKVTLILILLLLHIFLCAQVIPFSRTADWSQSGYPDSIPEPVLILDVMNYGAQGDGITDDFSSIISAINALNGMRGVIYFPPGTYKVGSSLNLPDSVILRGASSDSTHLKFDLQGAVGNCINISGSISSAFDTIVSALQGTNQIIVNDTSLYQTGMYLELLQDNGPWDTQPVSWADNSVGQIVRLDSIASTGSQGILFTQSSIRADYNNPAWGSNARIRIITPATEVGIECLQISRADSVQTGVCFNIWFNYAVNCWIKGIESSKSIGSHIQIDASSRISITGNYIHHAYLYDGSSTHGYGITLFSRTGECRIENNIMRTLRHSFSFQTGANGNVLAYNYSREPNRSEFPADYGADISFHGHYPYTNLVEGNIVQNIQLDQTWGPSGPFNTFFRNRAELYGILMTSGTVESNDQHFVGNEVTGTAPFTGNYLVSGLGHIEYGNMVKGILTPAATTPLDDTSYYLFTPPSFWISGPWPSIGIPHSPGSGSNPARDRFLAGGTLTVCKDDFTTGIANELATDNKFEIYPNPFTETINIHSASDINEPVHVQIFDATGRTMHETYAKIINGRLSIHSIHADQLSSGIYFLSISSSKTKLVFRIIKAG